MLGRRVMSAPIGGVSILLLVALLERTASVAAADVLLPSGGYKPLLVPQRSMRLPNTSYPLHYHLHISSSIHREDFDYSGNVTIDIAIVQPTNEIVLHAKNLTIHAITVRDLETGELFDDLSHTLDPLGSFLIIHALEYYVAFGAGQRVRVEILYAGVMNAKTFGIYWLTYNDPHNRTVYLAATQFEATSARLALPCYDEPSFKSNFSLRLTHGSDYMAISNTLAQHVQPDGLNHAGENMTTTTFHTTPPISTYLVAFVISDFEHISAEYRGVTQRIFTSSDIRDKGQKALKNAIRTVATLEDYFGMPYPLAKLDHIALKKNYGAAMENWGLITYREDTLVQVEGADDDDSDMYKQLKDIIMQNHEIAHQWFGNLVSPEWWTYAWLNEGFATYFSYIITDLNYPELKAMEFFLTDTAERAFSYNYITARPMTYYVEKESEVMSIFDIITYQRAACVIKMFHNAFNQRTFVRGINKYLRKFQYSVVNELHLFDALQAAVVEDPAFAQQSWGKSVREIMLSWTHSEWIPIVSIVRNYEDDTITIKQRSKNLQTQEHWWIPLNFATASDPEFLRTRVDYFMPPVPEITISAKELGITLKRDDWLLANKQQTGFYHVLYDDENLLMLSKTLLRNHTLIHPLNRGAIFQDLCPLIENNEIKSVAVIFELLKYLQYEEDLLPWNMVTDTIEFFEKNLYGTTSQVLYKQFVRQLIAPVFHKLFATPSPENFTNTEILARQKVLEISCMVDLPECLNYTRELAHNYFFGGVQLQTNTDYYGMHDSILCLGVKYLSDDEFAAIMDLFSKTERSSLLYDDLIYSLRCTQSRTHLREYLNLLLGENSTHSIMNDSESMMYVFYLYKANLAARPVVWRFFEHNYRLLCRSPFFAENFNRIAEYMPLRRLADFLRLRESIAQELASDEGCCDASSNLISANSEDIGKKVKLSELFLEKFGEQINQWLLRDQTPSVYAASVGAHSAASRLSYVKLFQSMSSLVRKLI